MKRADMQKGVIYAYRVKKSGPYAPIVMLDTEQIYRRVSKPEGVIMTTWAYGGCSTHFGRGYLAVTRMGDTKLGELREVTLEQALEGQPQINQARGVELIGIDPRYITGEWKAVMAEEKKRKRLADEAAWHRGVEEEERRALVNRLRPRLYELGVEFTVDDSREDVFVLTPQEMLKLLAP